MDMILRFLFSMSIWFLIMFIVLLNYPNMSEIKESVLGVGIGLGAGFTALIWIAFAKIKKGE